MAVITGRGHKYLQILVFAALAGVHARNFLYFPRSRGRGHGGEDGRAGGGAGGGLGNDGRKGGRRGGGQRSSNGDSATDMSSGF